MDTPNADIPVDARLVSRLLRSQHPDLPGPLRLVANGWDNAIFRLGTDLAVRVPRRTSAAHLIESEQAWLPVFAERVAVEVPAPVRIGRPSDEFPHAWSVVRWVEGIDAADVTAADRAPIATALADFVAAIHVPAPTDEHGGLRADVPRNPVRGVPLIDRDAAVRSRLAGGSVPHVAELARVWDDALAAVPWFGPALWIHGDLHPGNIVLGSDRALRAVIDFGDLTAGDPATDLATAWLTFLPDDRARFIDRVESHGRQDAATWRRARGWAVTLASALAANSDDNPRMAELGRHAIEQLLGEPVPAGAASA